MSGDRGFNFIEYCFGVLSRRNGFVYLEFDMRPYSMGKLTVAQHLPAVVDTDRNNVGRRSSFHKHLKPHSLESFRLPGPAAGSFRKNYCSAFMRLYIPSQFRDLGQSLPAILTVDQYRASVPEVVGNAGNTASKFLLAYKFRVMLPKVPDYRRDVIHALVVGHEYQGFIHRKVMWVLKAVACTEKVCAAHDPQVKQAHTSFMSFVTENIKANPLYTVKDHEQYSEYNEVQNSEWVSEELSHLLNKETVHWERFQFRFNMVHQTLVLAVCVVCFFQVFRDHLSRSSFNVMPLDHVHQFTIFEQRHARG